MSLDPHPRWLINLSLQLSSHVLSFLTSCIALLGGKGGGPVWWNSRVHQPIKQWGLRGTMAVWGRIWGRIADRENVWLMGNLKNSHRAGTRFLRSETKTIIIIRTYQSSPRGALQHCDSVFIRRSYTAVLSLQHSSQQETKPHFRFFLHSLTSLNKRAQKTFRWPVNDYRVMGTGAQSVKACGCWTHVGQRMSDWCCLLHSFCYYQLTIESLQQLSFFWTLHLFQ